METVKLFSSKLVAYFVTYPLITEDAELCAYYRRFNKALPVALAEFLIGVMITQAIRFVTSIFDGLPLLTHLMMLKSFILMDFIVFIIGCGSLLVKRIAASKEHKYDFAYQSKIRRCILIAGLVPTTSLVVFSLDVAEKTPNPAEFAGYLWFIMLGFQQQSCTWLLDGVAYKTLLFAIMNIGFCVQAQLRGYFTTTRYERMLGPVVIALFMFLANDRYVKDNFILRRMLKQQRNMYEKFLEKIQDSLIILTDTNVEFANEAAKARLGLTRESFQERASLMVTGNGIALSEYIDKRFDHQDSLSSDIVQERYYVQNENSELIGATNMVMVTFIESNGFYDGKTISIAMHDVTDELIQGEKRVEAKYKNMLLFSLSHELRTPLNIFQALLNVSKEYLCNGEAKEIRNDAKGAWRYLRNKISDILDYAQILNDSFKQHKSVFSLAQFVEQLRKITRRLLGKKRDLIRLEFAVQPNVRDIFIGDRDRLEQILFNFLSNGVKYTETGTISLSVFSPPTDKRLITFSVKDTGCGMSPESLSNLFELRGEVSPRLSSRRASSHDGGDGPSSTHRVERKAACLSGLGLTASRMICNRMGSEIHVSSQVGHGSVFSFSIFLHADADNSPANSDSSVPEEEVKVNDCKTKRYLSVHKRGTKILETSPTKMLAQREIVLIVDDNDFNRIVANAKSKAMVSKLGYRTMEAENGLVALERLHEMQSQASTTIVLMDLDMPVMDGIQATIEIRKEERGPRPFIAALTAFASEKERTKCTEAGMNFFISKPLTKESLMELFERFRKETKAKET